MWISPKYYDTIQHHHLRAFLDRRVTDGVIRRMIDKWLKAGVLEHGLLQRTTEGTPQGGVVSPLLANIYLHHVLDEWFERDVRARLRGNSILVRYADDSVMAFETLDDAKRVMDVLGKRLARYGLTLHPSKTHLVDFRFHRPEGVCHPDTDSATIKLVNDAGIPIIEANNKAGFGRSDVKVLTYVGADDVEFGRLQGKLLDQAFGGKKAKVGYVMGFAGTSPQILRAKGWEEFRAKNPQYEEVARVTDDFDAAKALAVVQDLLSRFPKGQLDAIILQGPEASAAADFATRSGREEVKFIVGDYPQDVRQLIYGRKIFGTVDQDPYPQAYNAMRMAWLHFNGKDADIPKPYFLPLPLVTKENAEKTPAAWGC